MLELLEGKLSRPVLRRGGERNLASLAGTRRRQKHLILDATDRRRKHPIVDALQASTSRCLSLYVDASIQ